MILAFGELAPHFNNSVDCTCKKERAKSQFVFHDESSWNREKSLHNNLDTIATRIDGILLIVNLYKLHFCFTSHSYCL